MHLDVDAARRGDHPRTSPSRSASTSVEAAWGIERIVNANMANATRQVLAQPRRRPSRPRADRLRRQRRGARVRDRAPSSAIERMLRPEGRAGVLGARRARRRLRRRPRPLVRRRPLSQVDLGRVRDAHDRARDEVAKELDPTGLDAAETSSSTLYAQMCYPGQNFDMSVPVPEGATLDEPGPARPRRALPRPARSRARLLLPHPAADRCAACGSPRGAAPRSPTTSPRSGHLSLADSARRGQPPRPLRARGSSTPPVYDGAALGIGAEVHGPALDRGAVHRPRGAAGGPRPGRRRGQLRARALR